MADGGNISSGIGTGWAQVFDTSGLVRQYAQREQQKQKILQQQQEETNKELAGIQFDGVKAADTDYFKKKYDAIVDASQAKKNASTIYDRLKADNEFKKNINELRFDINKSKEDQKLYLEARKFGGSLLDNQKVKGFNDTVSKINSLSTFSPERQALSTDSLFTKTPTVDLSKKFDDILSKSTISRETPLASAGYGKLKYGNVTELSADKARQNLYNEATRDHDFLGEVQRVYLDPFANTDRQSDVIEAKKLGIPNYDPDSLLDYTLLQNFKTAKGTDKYDKVKTSYVGETRTPITNINVNTGSGDRVSAGTAIENQPVSFTNKEDVVGGKKVTNLKENTVARKWLPVNNAVDVSTYGGIDLDTGDKYTDKDVISGKVLGIGSFPILKQTGGFVKDRHINQLDEQNRIGWKDMFIVTVPANNLFEQPKRIAVPLSQYPLADAWSKAYKELGVKGQIKGSNIEASSAHTERLNKIQTPLKPKSISKTAPKVEAKSTPKTTKKTTEKSWGNITWNK